MTQFVLSMITHHNLLTPHTHTLTVHTYVLSHSVVFGLFPRGPEREQLHGADQVHLIFHVVIEPAEDSCCLPT